MFSSLFEEHSDIYEHYCVFTAVRIICSMESFVFSLFLSFYSAAHWVTADVVLVWGI